MARINLIKIHYALISVRLPLETLYLIKGKISISINNANNNNDNSNNNNNDDNNNNSNNDNEK